jgi:RHS repeat-associated protein
VDQLNRITKVKDQGLSTASIAYDSHSRPLTVTDPKGNATAYTYDGLGNTTQISNPDTMTSNFKYDSAGNLTKATDSRAVVTNYTYDALDRMLTRQYPTDTSLNVSITYDSAAAGYRKAIGHIASLTDQVGSLSRSYDERGNILFNSRTITGQTYKTGYTYESAGRLSSITYASSGTVINYGRDSAGQISYVSTTPHNSSTSNLASYVKHMPFGPASSWTYGNGLTDSRTFDLDYRMTSVTDTGTGNIQYLSYSYNAANRVTAIIDHVSAAKNQSFTYDRTGQITFASGSYGSSTVTYDSNSNRLTAAGINYTYYAGTNRLKKWGTTRIFYTSTGNLTSIGIINADVLTYNKANQLASVTPNGASTSGYNYDAFGQRLKLKTGTTPFQVQNYDLDGHMLTETSAAASPVETDYAYMDGLPIAAIQAATSATPTIAALHTDNIGTPQRATNAAKTIVFTVDYSPCGIGTPTTTITQDLRFPGQIADVTGLNHNGFRDMSKVFCTYGQADLIGPQFSGSASFNPYPYAGNNPITNIDPSGLDWVYFQSLGVLAHYNMSFASPPSTMSIVNQIVSPQSSMSGPNPDYVAVLAYSGHGIGLNNPSMQNIQNVGPITQGSFTFGREQDYVTARNHKLKNAMIIKPLPGTYTFGRGGYMFHGDNAAANRSGSEGCIVTDKDTRDQIEKFREMLKDNRLDVVR